MLKRILFIIVFIWSCLTYHPRFAKRNKGIWLHDSDDLEWY
jgi:hypothetical protein